jgi:hypothetical protein
MDADALDAAVAAADVRVEQLFADLRRQADGRNPAVRRAWDAETAASSWLRPKPRPTPAPPPADRDDWWYDHLFGDGNGEPSDSDADAPEPRQPSVATPAPRVRGSVNLLTPSPWLFNSFGGGDVEVATRFQLSEGVTAVTDHVLGSSTPSRGNERRAGTVRREDDAGRSTRTPRRLARVNQSLRRAIDDIVGGEIERRDSGFDASTPREERDDVDEMLERERRVTENLRDGVAAMRATERRRASADANARVEARRAKEKKQRASEADRIMRAEAKKPDPPVPRARVVFHRASQTEFSHRRRPASTQTVYIHPSLIESFEKRPPWGGGAGGSRRWQVRNQVAAVAPRPTLKPTVARVSVGVGSDAPPSKSPRRVKFSPEVFHEGGGASELAAESDAVIEPIRDAAPLSGFEERCAVAISTYLVSLDARRRAFVLNDWGASDGRFDGAELCVRVDVQPSADGGILVQTSKHAPPERFVPIDPQPLRALRLCLSTPLSKRRGDANVAPTSLAWIRIDHDEHGSMDLPKLCASMLYRERAKDDDEGKSLPRGYFVNFSFKEHARVFRHAVYLAELRLKAAKDAGKPSGE